MRIIAALLLSLCATSAQAQYNFQILPEHPRTTDDIVAVVTSTSPTCTPLPLATAAVDVGGGIYRIWIGGSDACESAPPATRSYNLGRFPAGSHTLRFVECGGLDPATGEEACRTVREVSLLVSADQRRATIPSLSGWSVLTLVLAVGLLSARRRSIR